MISMLFFFFVSASDNQTIIGRRAAELMGRKSRFKDDAKGRQETKGEVNGNQWWGIMKPNVESITWTSRWENLVFISDSWQEEVQKANCRVGEEASLIALRDFKKCLAQTTNKSHQIEHILCHWYLREAVREKFFDPRAEISRYTQRKTHRADLINFPSFLLFTGRETRTRKSEANLVPLIIVPRFLSYHRASKAVLFETLASKFGCS